MGFAMTTTTSFATVTAITGRVWVRQTDGALRELRPGDAVVPGSEIITAGGASVTLAVDGAAPITIGENRSVALTDDLINPADPAAAAITPPPNWPIPHACSPRWHRVTTRLAFWKPLPRLRAAPGATMAAAALCACCALPNPSPLTHRRGRLHHGQCVPMRT